MNYIFNLNPEIQRRDEILFGKYDKSTYAGGCRYFENASLSTMEQLLKENFLDGSKTFNSSPDMETFIAFAREHKDATFVFGGHAISADREDYRIDIDSIGLAEGSAVPSDRTALDFVNTFRFADELNGEPETLYAWFD